MKTIYKHKTTITINDMENFYTSSAIHYGEMPTDEKKVITDFFEAYNNYAILGIEADETLFKHKPYLFFRYDFNLSCRVDPKDFESMIINTVYTETNDNYTFKELADRLPAEEFLEWLKDNGVDLKSFIIS